MSGPVPNHCVSYIEPGSSQITALLIWIVNAPIFDFLTPGLRRLPSPAAEPRSQTVQCKPAVVLSKTTSNVSPSSVAGPQPLFVPWQRRVTLIPAKTLHLTIIGSQRATRPMRVAHPKIEEPQVGGPGARQFISPEGLPGGDTPFCHPALPAHIRAVTDRI
jgi:hypothetical protein